MTFISKKTNKIIIISALTFVTGLYFLLSFQMFFFKTIYPSKIWAHRVNSIEKYSEAQNKYTGVELDIVYDSINNIFDVNHPPAKSIGLNLKSFFKSKKEGGNFNIWLDYKNLNKYNFKESAKKLEEISSSLKINFGNIIVESSNPIYLLEFSKRGFKTSYYLPATISTYNDERISRERKIIDSNNLDYISSNFTDYNFIKENFPNKKLLTWIINNPINIRNPYTLKLSIINFIRNFKIINDKDVRVVLFKFNAISGNR